MPRAKPKAQSNAPVYFDNLVVTMEPGALLEERHYYPYGLPIQGWGSSAAGSLTNRQRYQSNEYREEAGLNWMDFHNRQYDPQIGRFLGIDPLADDVGQQTLSPYLAMGANPACNVDPLGLQSMQFRDMIPNAGAGVVEGQMVVLGASAMGGGRSTAMQSLMNQMGSASAERFVAAWLGEALKGFEDSYIKQNADGTQTFFYFYVHANANNNGAQVTGEHITIGSGGQQQNGATGGKGGFLGNNWQDVAFMANDLAQALGNNSSLKSALRMGRPTTMLYIPPGISLSVSTKVMSSISKVAAPIAKYSPYVSFAATGVNIVQNSQFTVGDAYSLIITRVAMVPGWGWAVGGGALLLEGVSYLTTGQGVADNINQQLNGGVILGW